MELDIYKINGEKANRKAKLNDSIYAIEPNDHAIYLDVKQHLANKRQGNSSSLERGFVRGSTRKIKRQKGTGTARAGSIKSPLFRGGGTIFGPEPRDYHFKLNKKLKQLARRSALSYKARDKHIIVLENFSFDEPKTRQFVELLQQFELNSKKALLVIPDNDTNIYLSSRNLKKARVVTADTINTYEVMNANMIILTEGSLEKIEDILARN